MGHGKTRITKELTNANARRNIARSNLMASFSPCILPDFINIVNNMLCMVALNLPAMLDQAQPQILRRPHLTLSCSTCPHNNFRTACGCATATANASAPSLPTLSAAFTKPLSTCLCVECPFTFTMRTRPCGLESNSTETLSHKSAWSPVQDQRFHEECERTPRYTYSLSPRTSTRRIPPQVPD